MNDRTRVPTLTDQRGMGGVIATEGFDYQLWDGLARLPGWLARADFEQVIFEGLEDLEARFFAPQAPHMRLVERFQAKSGDLKPAEIREVFESFRVFEASFPRLTRVHTLVTPRLPPTLRWIARDTARVRRARPFYAPFQELIQASDQALRDQLVAEYGAELGTFVSEFVEVDERPAADRSQALQAFAAALQHHFPAQDFSARATERVFTELELLVRQNVGAPLSRLRLLKCIEAELGAQLLKREPFRILIRSDRNESDDAALVIDAASFSGGAAPFPESAAWQASLIRPLNQTADWLRHQGVSRIALAGSYRLSTAIVAGRAFRSAAGFDIDIPTREGPWSTNQHPMADAPPLPWKIENPERTWKERLVVAVGILREPAVTEIALTLSPEATGSLQRLQLNQPIRNGVEAQLSVRAVKDAISSCVQRLGAAHIDLFIAAPAAFAVALGHRWNGLPFTQLYEYLSGESRFVATARLQ